MTLSIVLPAILTVTAVGLWIAMLFMFRPSASIDFALDAVTVNVDHAKITKVEHGDGRVTIHIDRKVKLS